jgi:predicted transcriptional regulator
MHVFWERGESTVADVRDEMAAAGRDLAYTTVATLTRILAEKGFLEQTNQQRPFRYQPVRSFEEVSRSLVGDLVDRVFHG